jgi:hypothetical protein
MSIIDRRAFLRGSIGTVALTQVPAIAFAQVCVTSGLAPFAPNRLTVDCASRRNFAIWRKNTQYMGLAGAVSMTFVRGRYGEYPAGNLFLFPWLNKKGQGLGAGKDWQTVMPLNLTRVTPAGPIPNWRMPLDEYFLRYRLEVPSVASFIGFRVLDPVNLQDSRRAWYQNVAKLADGKGAGIGWTSSNLNGPWFGGSRWIPKDDTCNGKKWRTLIIDGLNQASIGGAC